MAPQTSSEISEGKNIIIDLNGYNIKSTLNDAIINRGNLKVTDSKQTGSITINLIGTSSEYANGIINESTGILEIDNNVTILVNSSYTNGIKNQKGTVELENIKIESKTGENTNVIYNDTGIMNLQNSTLDFNSSSISVYNNIGIINASGITALNYGKITTYKGEVNITGENTCVGTFINIPGKSFAYEETKINITNAKIISKGKINSSKFQIISGTKGTLTIKNSELSNEEGQVISAGKYSSDNNNGMNTIIENSVLESGDWTTINYGTAGNLEIKDCTISNSYNSTSSTSATIYFSSTKELKITGQSNITSTKTSGISNKSTGRVVIGEKIAEGETEEPNDVPIIKGIYGIYNESGDLYYYDGIIEGSKSYDAIYGKITETETGYDAIKTENTETATVMVKLERLPVVQIGEEKYYTLNEAIQSVEDTEETTITLLRELNIMESQTSIEIAEGKNIIIDLNGYNIKSTLNNAIINRGNLKVTDNKQTGRITINLTGTSSTYANGIVNESTGVLEIDNNVKIVGDGAYINVIYNNTGTINLKDITIDFNDRNSSIYNNMGIINASGITALNYGKIATYKGEVNITGENTCVGTFINIPGKSTAYEETKVNITNATIKTEGEMPGAIISGQKGTLTIKNSELTSEEGYIIGAGKYRTYDNNGMDTIIENSIIKTSGFGDTINYGSAGNLEIKDSTISNSYNISVSSYGAINFSSSKELKIIGESNIISTNNNGIYNASTGTVLIEEMNGTPTIEGRYGIYNKSTGTIVIGQNDENVNRIYPCIIGEEYGIYNLSGTLGFYDGQIKGKTGTIYGSITELATGHEINKTSGEYYTDILVRSGVEVSVASINSIKYTSLQDAIYACTDGVQTTIVIENNITTTNTVIIPETKDIVIDLNGFTIQGENIETVIENNGTLQIVDNLDREGTIKNTTGVAIKNNGTLKIGKEDEKTSITSPNIQGATNAIQGNVYFYDGTLKGTTAVIGTITPLTGYTLNSQVSDNIETIILQK